MRCKAKTTKYSYGMHTVKDASAMHDAHSVLLKHACVHCQLQPQPGGIHWMASSESCRGRLGLEWPPCGISKLVSFCSRLHTFHCSSWETMTCRCLPTTVYDSVVTTPQCCRHFSGARWGQFTCLPAVVACPKKSNRTARYCLQSGRNIHMRLPCPLSESV